MLRDLLKSSSSSGLPSLYRVIWASALVKAIVTISFFLNARARQAQPGGCTDNKPTVSGSRVGLRYMSKVQLNERRQIMPGPTR
jgi:hypothetical protein